jgi:hypothetical protein
MIINHKWVVCDFFQSRRLVPRMDWWKKSGGKLGFTVT